MFNPFKIVDPQEHPQVLPLTRLSQLASHVFLLCVSFGRPYKCFCTYWIPLQQRIVSSPLPIIKTVCLDAIYTRLDVKCL